MIHPNVAFDLRSQTAVTDVIAYQIRQDGQAVRNGSIGTWGGVEFIENLAHTSKLVLFWRYRRIRHCICGGRSRKGFSRARLR